MVGGTYQAPKPGSQLSGIGGTYRPSGGSGIGGTYRNANSPRTLSQNVASYIPAAGSVQYGTTRPTGGRGRTGPKPPSTMHIAIGEAQQGISDEYAAAIQAIMDEYGAAIGGSGGGGYGSAIKEAQDALADVRANREAIKQTYSAYGAFIDPLSQEAVDAAIQMVADANPAFAGIAATAGAELQAAFAGGEQVLSEEAKLIGATAGQIDQEVEKIQAEQTMFEDQERQRSTTAAELLQLQSEAYRTQAVADQKLDQGAMRREAYVTDLGFADMEEQAKAAIAAARQAAAAAASRRRALAAERDKEVALLLAEKNEAMKFNPEEAGEVNALHFLRTKASKLNYNRQQLLWNTLGNVISEHVPLNQLTTYLGERNVRLTPEERGLLVGAHQAFNNGMLRQQRVDANEPTRNAAARNVSQPY